MNVRKIIRPFLYATAIASGAACLVKYTGSYNEKYDRAPVKDEFNLSVNEAKTKRKQHSQKTISWKDAVTSFSNQDDNQSNISSNSMGVKGMVPYKNVDNAFIYTTKMAIDADGSPHAYAVPASGKVGLDVWRSVYDESTGAIDGVVLDATGKPVQNGGYFISPTSLADITKEDTDPSKYVDSEKTPYFVLPEGGFNGAEFGDIGVIYNKENGKYTYAVFADEGPIGFLGEASIAAAKAIGVNPDAKKLTQFDNITYIVFPKSGDGPDKIPTNGEIEKKGEKLFKRWGGVQRIKGLYNR